ncbi:MAG: HD domain-containing protein [Lachnospiraceae bacterium]|nr:HD domain-containing protein [Lachnospiraceae bacterium]
MKDEIRDIIVKYGKDILLSDEFQETFSQTHHMSTTVGDHTLGVAAEAVKICLRHGLTDDETLRNTVAASLCHDLGIMGREEKFNNNVQCLVRHPKQSAESYISMTGEQNERVLDSILCHMFPLKIRFPRYKEGWILTLADKIGASREKIGRPSVTASDRDELMRAASRFIKRARDEDC